jgi:hypothetical protein
MGTHRKFRPSCLMNVVLEERMVLNGSSTQLATPVLLQGLNGPARPFRPHTHAPVSALVDLAYQSFQQDYQSVRATYLASVQNRTALTTDMVAFGTYTTQRVNLLAQQVTNSLLLYSQGTTRGHRQDNPVPLIIARINGTATDTRATPRQTSNLRMNLMTSIPDPTASPTTIAIDTIAQDNAIEASRVATLNGVTIVRNGNFGNGSSSRKH